MCPVPIAFQLAGSVFNIVELGEFVRHQLTPPVLTVCIAQTRPNYQLSGAALKPEQAIPGAGKAQFECGYTCEARPDYGGMNVVEETRD